ncbi:MAG: hypothetical protein A2014_08100 [Spirochaetes bacterium GWF1_49_6]|nr:MAG: hypothetical protein A2014_08100 [Spirochaetes bacterium GWF1_49_6]
MQDYKIGMVIPIYQTSFIRNTVKTILKENHHPDLVICIVNDGQKAVENYLAKFKWDERVHILNLPENRCFAGANNAGWRYLIEQFPSIEFLGTINDDTTPRKNWLTELHQALVRHPKTALAAPTMETREGFFRTFEDSAVYNYQDAVVTMIKLKNTIDRDTFVPVVGGFCFLGRREALEQVGFFDEGYRNSCEDVDLCLKLLTANWRLVAAPASRVYHFAGKSRYMKGTSTNGDLSHNLLEKKWGFDLRKFNQIDEEGFFVK